MRNDKFEGKKILLVGKETFMYPFYYLTDKWSLANEIAMFWINQNESDFDECELNQYTYYMFKKTKPNIKHFTLCKAAEEFSDLQNSSSIDSDRLSDLEKKYSHFKNFNRQIISDQRFTGHYHFRTMYGPVTYEQQLIWLELLYKHINMMFDEFKPDVVFDCDIAELPRTVINEVAFSRHIPYICISFSQYETYKIPSYNLILDLEDYFLKAYRDALKSNNDEEKKYIIEYRKRNEIKNTSYLAKGNLTYTYTPDSIGSILQNIASQAMYFYRQDKSKKNRKLKKENPILYINSRQFMKFWSRYLFMRRKLFLSNNFFENPVDGEFYVYMPLHLIPESTTFSMAPFWINELSIIEAVSKSIPAGWRLYVKEHQSMLGERGISFYERVKSIPNVRLVKPNYYSDPKPWIINSKAVVTITGTTAYEAALLGVPAFTFGTVPFSVIKGIRKVSDVEELPKLFANLNSEDNLAECAAYIKAVKTIGKPVDLYRIQSVAHDNLARGQELDNWFLNEIEILRALFEEAYFAADSRLAFENV